MNIRFRQLEAFVLIVETGGVTTAAKQLNLTQSSVSKLLSGLETELGFVLFDRVGRQLRLSEQGRAFLKKARETIAAFGDIQRTAEDIRDNHGRKLRICAIGPLAFGALVPQAIAEFARANPEFSLSFETKFRIEIEEWVAQGGSDLGFTLLPLSHHGLEARSLEPVNAVAVVPAGHPFEDRAYLEPSDLVKEPKIMPHGSARVRALVEANFMSAGHRLSPKIETSNALSAVHLVSQGAGVSVLDPFSCMSIPAGGIKLIPWMPETPMTYGMIWQKSRTLSAIDHQFFDLVKSSIEAHSVQR